MSGNRFLSIGECMIELSQAGDGLLRKGFAGDTFNTVWYARAFLPDHWSAAYLTGLGDDAASDEMRAFVESAGVETDAIRTVPGRSPGLYMIHLKNGERSFSYWRETSAAKQLAADPEHLRKAIDASGTVYFSGITLAILSKTDRDALLSELSRARNAGKNVVFDPNIRPRLWSDPETMLAAVTEGARVSNIVMPSFDDEATHFGDKSVEETAKRYRDAGAEIVVVKNGEAGITIVSEGQNAFVPATSANAVIDTTSAGDSFNGAFLASYLQDGDALKAASFGAKIASAVIGHHGALIEKNKLL